MRHLPQVPSPPQLALTAASASIAARSRFSPADAALLRPVVNRISEENIQGCATEALHLLNILQGIEPEKPKEAAVEKVALYSDHNKHTTDKQLGSLKVGYNIVTKEAADWWLTRKGVREATPNEIARHYGIE